MTSRFASIWFRHLLTDWYVRQHPHLKKTPIVFTMPERGRPCVVAVNEQAERSGVGIGMALADARTFEPLVQNIEGKDGFEAKLLYAIATYCVRYSPKVSIMPPNGIVLDMTGCAHLWGGEGKYLKEIVISLRTFGYDVRAAMADTIGAAWAVARCGTDRPIIASGRQREAMFNLPPTSLRINAETADQLKRLGFNSVGQLLDMPRSTLIRRFGKELCLRLDQGLGAVPENLLYQPHHDPYIENLMTPEGVASAESIAAALTHLLEELCERLNSEHKGVRYLVLDCFRVDGKVETVEIGTSRPSRCPKHLFKLFVDKLDKIEPALGIEQFRLTASQIEKMDQVQNSLLGGNDGFNDVKTKEMFDRIANRLDPRSIFCFVPLERYWPENSVKAVAISEIPNKADWKKTHLRPVDFLNVPEPIEVTAPIPDYPPMMFRHRKKMHRIKHADGPERIEREWWLGNGPPRDYFKLEDEDGERFWVFRDNQYDADQPPRWYIHGYFS